MLSSFPVIFSSCSQPGVFPSSTPWLYSDTSFMLLWFLARAGRCDSLFCKRTRARRDTGSSVRAGTPLPALCLSHHLPHSVTVHGAGALDTWLLIDRAIVTVKHNASAQLLMCLTGSFRNSLFITKTQDSTPSHQS